MSVEWRMRAHSAALTRLTHEHWDRYRTLFDTVKADIAVALAAGDTQVNTRPQSRAKTLLAREHRERFHQLYAEERYRLANLPPGQRHAQHPRGTHWRPGR